MSASQSPGSPQVLLVVAAAKQAAEQPARDAQRGACCEAAGGRVGAAVAGRAEDSAPPLRQD